MTSTAVVDGLLRLCQSSENRLFLQALGMTIGIKTWSDDFMEMQKETTAKASVSKTVSQPLHTQSTGIEKVCYHIQSVKAAWVDLY